MIHKMIDKMQIETIQYGDYTAKINVSRGANCIQLHHKKYNAEILRVPAYEVLDNPYLYGMPILFPVNRIQNGRFEFEGRSYCFPINEQRTNCALHGELHETVFEIINKEEHKLACRYRATEENPYMFFSHKFDVEIAYELSSEGLFQTTVFHNNSDRNMPLLLGFHTTFNIPFINGTDPDDICIYADVSEEFERGTDDYLPTGNIVHEDYITETLKTGRFISSQKISRHYRAGNSGIMRIEDLEKHCRIVYENDCKYGFRLIYGEGKGFLCLEPQTCIVNAPNAPFDKQHSGFDSIEPGEKKIYRSHIFIEEIEEI